MELFEQINGTARSHPNLFRRSAAASVLAAALVGSLEDTGVSAHLFWDRTKNALFVAVKFADEQRWNLWESELQHHPERGWPSVKIGERDAFGALHPRGHAYAFRGPDGLMLKIKNRPPVLVACDLKMACFESLVQSEHHEEMDRTADRAIESPAPGRSRRPQMVPALFRPPQPPVAVAVGRYRVRPAASKVCAPVMPSEDDFTEQDIARLRGAIPARYTERLRH